MRCPQSHRKRIHKQSALSSFSPPRQHPEAARLRAVYNFKMPDPIHLATAIIHQADVFLTNDHRLASVRQLVIKKLDEL
ncbi:MAG: type II toxin-antitoxin system VapC family toxin [Solirubrobacterales bacterium]